MSAYASCMRWECSIESLDARSQRYVIFGERKKAIPYSAILKGWSEDFAFRQYFAGLLRNAPFAAYRWETPAVSAGTIEHGFEFVLIDAPGLQRPPEPHVFDEQIGGLNDPAVAFSNLGGDATLIVPRQMGDAESYVHLASFARGAPPGQMDFLFQLVGRTVLSRLGPSPLWLSTAGMGVAWLHVRIDSRPKYYGYEPYTR